MIFTFRILMSLTGLSDRSVGVLAMASTTSIPSSTSPPQPHLPLTSLGPDLEDFPSGMNPLTGRAVQDPSLLGLPEPA